MPRVVRKKVSFAERARMGGFARAAILTEEQLKASSAKANRARSRKLTAAQRSAIARQAAEARWSKKAS